MTRSLHTGNRRAATLNLVSFIDGGVLVRAAVVALVIGSILTLTNQSAAIFGNDELEYIPLALVFITPFVVVAISQLLGIQQAVMDALQRGGHQAGEGSFFATALAHGIPLKTIYVGMLIGSVNASIVITTAFLEGANVSSLPVAVMAQAYALPLLFGLMSQTIAFRRAAQALQLERQRSGVSTGPASIPRHDRSLSCVH